ncbi:MAG: hypothetical protein IT303_20280 [Dehalococcoidia bacterium]|nr:hypothetical protein [Dehalococcoidia bacterium]
MTPDSGPGALALLCGEAEVQSAFARFLEEHWGAADRVAVPGGAWWVAQAADLTEGRVKKVLLRGRAPVKEVVELLLDRVSLRQVVVLGHQDCGWYRREARAVTAGELVRRIGADMLRAREEIERWAPRRITVEGYMLTDSGGQADFRKLF